MCCASMQQGMENLETIEAHVAHLQKLVEELSDVVARQDSEIAVLTKRVEMLMMREAERQVSEDASVPLADQKPPHW